MTIELKKSLQNDVESYFQKGMEGHRNGGIRIISISELSAYLKNTQVLVIDRFQEVDVIFDTLIDYALNGDDDVVSMVAKAEGFFDYFGYVCAYFAAVFDMELDKISQDFSSVKIAMEGMKKTYQDQRQTKSFQQNLDDIHSVQNKIEVFLLSFPEFSYQKLYSIETIDSMIGLLKNKNISTQEYNFLYNSIWYIIYVLISSNLFSGDYTSGNLKTYFDGVQDKEFKTFLIFTLFIFGGVQKINNFEDDFNTDYKIARELEKEYGDFCSFDNLLLFAKSYLHQQYYLEKRESFSQIKTKIFLQNPELFIHHKNIPYKKLFAFINAIQDEEILSKIQLFLQERNGLKLKEPMIILLLENIIKTQHIFSYGVLIVGIKYIEGGFAIDDVLGLGEDLLRKVDNYSGNKTLLLKELIKNPLYLEEKEKQNYIDSIKKDLVYLSDDDEGKNAILDSLDTLITKTLDDLKIEILSLKIKYCIDEKILFAKKIFKNSLQNLTFKLDILDQLETTCTKDFLYKSDIYEYIFSLGEDDISYVLFIFKHLDLPKNISYKAFLEVSGILLKKRKFVTQIIHGKQGITLDELKQELESKTMVQKINSAFYSMLSRELYDMLKNSLKLENAYFIDEKTLLVLDIFKILEQKFYEDFVLHLDYLSRDACKNIYECIQLYKYYGFNVHAFSEYLIAQNSKAQIDICKQKIHNSFLEKVLDTQEFQSEIMSFLKNGDISRFELYISSIHDMQQEMQPSVAKNEIDNYICDIYNNGDIQQKEFLVRKLQIFLKNIIDVMHPSQTTSTCNSHFGKGSGSYSEVLGNKIFKKLLKGTEENDDQYLKRILSLNFHALLEVENISDINTGYHELKCLYMVSLHKNEKESLISFLYDMQEIMISLNGESYTDLTELKKYFHNQLEKILRKLKRSLGI